MNRLVVKEIGDGMHPSEVLVEIATNGGREEMFLDRRQLDGWSSVSIGFPVTLDSSGYSLVELPRETARGQWRVWVSKDSIR